MKNTILPFVLILLFSTASFLPAQNVGINTTTPQTSLHVADDNTVTGGLTIGTGTVSDGGNLRLLGNLNHWNLDNFQGNLRFFTETGFGTGGIERFRINENGNAGFNETAGDVGLLVRNPSASNPFILNVRGADGTDRFKVQEDGTAGFNGIVPGEGLTVQNPSASNSLILNVRAANGNTRFQVEDSGHLFAFNIPYGDASNMQYNAINGQFLYDNSSRRYKENIHPLQDNFHLILQAQPKTYTRPGDSCRWEVGYIAEEMDSLGLTKLVSYDTAGIPDGFNYEKMILYVNEILKEHHSEIAQLKTDNAQLTRFVNEMRGELSLVKYLLVCLMVFAVPFLIIKKIYIIMKSLIFSLRYQKRYLPLLFITLLFFQTSNAQLYLESGATITTTSNVQITLNNISLNNMGTFDGTNSTVTVQESNGNSNLNFGGSGTTTLNHLNIDLQTQDVLLTGDVSIEGDLTFLDGLFDLNNNDLTLVSSGTILGESEGASFIGPNGGEIIKTVTLNAPNGVNPGNIGAEITAALNLESTTIRRGHVPQTGSSGTSIHRYYDISPQTNNGLNATLRFHYLDTELVGQVEDDLELWRNDGSGWTNEGFTNRDLNANYVELTGIDGFSIWTAADMANALPVELLHFNAQVDDQQNVQLKWVTASERNNDYFFIERSVDAISFETIGQISGRGNTSTAAVYTFLDNQPFSGTSYYRLKQVDFNGAFLYSEVKPIKILLGAITIYPNPVNELLNIAFVDYQHESVKLSIHNMMGKTIWTGEKEVKDDISLISLAEVQVITPGSYLLNIFNEGEKPTSINFVKMK